MKSPLSFHASLLAFGLSILGCHEGFAQTVERLCPATGAGSVFGAPRLAWAYGSENLLSNPGFEGGTNDWSVPPLSSLVGSPQDPAPAAEGSRYLQVTSGRVSREVTLPDGDSGLSLSYFVGGLTSLSGRELVQVEPADRSEPPQWLPVPAYQSNGRWQLHCADLSAFRGRTIRLTWIFRSEDGVARGLDDVRITPVPAGATFEVWLRPAKAPDFVSLGRTATPSWPLSELKPLTIYDWRVDVLENGVVYPGTVSRFMTSEQFGVRRLEVGDLPPVQCPGERFPVTVRVSDDRGFPAPRAMIDLNLSAGGEIPGPPGVILTEVDTGVRDGVEFQNVSDQAVDLSNWQVSLLSRAATIAVTLPAGSRLEPGQRFTLAEGRLPGSPWPNLPIRGPLDWGDTPGTPLAAAVLWLDPTGVIRDCVLIEPAPRTVDRIPIPVHAGRVNAVDWRDLPVSAMPANGETYQRISRRDQNLSEDWKTRPSTFGEANPDLDGPWISHFVPVTVDPAKVQGLRTDAEGRVQFMASLTGAGTGVVLQARLRAADGLGIRTWESAPSVLNPAACLSLVLPEQVRESDGVLSGALRVVLREPASTNLVVHLEYADSRISGPVELMIPAGAIEAQADLGILNDEELSGSFPVAITARAPGFSPTTRSILVQDDETATMRLEIADSWVEGAPEMLTLILNRPTRAALNIPIQSSAPNILGTGNNVFIPAGADRGTTFLYATENDLFTGPASATITASFEAWPTVSKVVTITDNETNTVTLGLMDATTALEGQSDLLFIELGGAATTNLMVTLSVSDPARIQISPTVEIPAGTRFLTVPFRVSEDDQKTGRLTNTVAASISGYQPGLGSIVIRDNDPGRLRMLQPSGPETVDGNVATVVRAETVDGDPLPNADLSQAKVWLVTDEGRSGPPGIPVRVEGGYSVSIIPRVPHPATRLQVEALGLAAESLPIPIWPATAPTGKDAAYDAPRDRILVVPGSGAAFAVSAADGRRTEFSDPMEDADALIPAGDGETLHVLHAGRTRIARYRLATLTREADWPVGVNDQGQTLLADHVTPIPRQPQSLMMSRYRSPSETGLRDLPWEDVAVMDGPTLRSKRISLNLLPGASSSVTVAASADEAYLVMAGQLATYALDASGLTLKREVLGSFVPGAPAAPTQRSVEFHGMLLTPHGKWLDPRLPGELGEGVGWGGISPDENCFGYDPARDVVGWIRGGERPMFRLLDPHSLQIREEIPVTEGAAGPIVRLEPAGPARWLLVHAGRFRLFPVSPIAPPPVDLAVTATVESEDPYQGTARVVFQISNPGNSRVEDVDLTLGLPPFAFTQSRPPVQFPEPGPRSHFDLNALLRFHLRLGPLDAGARIEIPLILASVDLKEVLASAVVGARTSDSHPEDNRVEIRTTVAPAPAPALRLLPGDPAQPDTLRLEHRGRYLTLYRIEKAASLDGPWEPFTAADSPGSGVWEPLLFVRNPSEASLFYRIRELTPE